MSIHWEKSAGTGNYYGYTESDIKNEELHTYKIECFTHLVWVENNNYVRVPCATIADAQKMAEIIEGGRNV